MLRASFVMFVALVAGVIGFTGPEASAFPVMTSPALQADAGSQSIVDVRFNGGGNHGNFNGKYNGKYYGKYNGKKYWNNKYGRRCNGWTNYCRYRYNGYWYSNQWWIGPTVGLGIGMALTSSSRHVAWCESRYRSYNPRNNTWVSNSGKVKKCNSPYD